jgi:MFS family permease
MRSGNHVSHSYFHLPSVGLEIAVDGRARTAARPAPITSSGPTFQSVFAIREFRAVWLAQLLSVAGDQLARVAITVLVYDRTHSALWTAVTYAVTLLPWLLGGLALSGLADRFPRRSVMVVCDMARMVLVGLMVLLGLLVSSGWALIVTVGLLFVVTLLDSPFKAARSALLPEILAGELYVRGMAIGQVTLQVGMVTGFALGGLVVALLRIRAALLIDAATFAASAILVWYWILPRPVASSGHAAKPSLFSDMASGVRLVFADRQRRTLMLLGWLVAFYVVPMGLAAPYAARFQAVLPIPVGTGLIFAAGPLGTAIGAVVFGRFVAPDQRQRWMGPLAAASCGLLLLCWFQPNLIASLAIIAASGACACYQLAANAEFVRAVPPERRGQAFGLANGGMQVSQGIWIVLAGAAASKVMSPAEVIAISGGLGAALAVGLAVSWHATSVSLRGAAES